jgi:hypothetical protein
MTINMQDMLAARFKHYSLQTPSVLFDFNVTGIFFYSLRSGTEAVFSNVFS